jgi:hypothetical protein
VYGQKAVWSINSRIEACLPGRCDDDRSGVLSANTIWPRLDLSPGRPLLVVESVDVTPDGKPIATATGRFAADRVELMVEY